MLPANFVRIQNDLLGDNAAVWLAQLPGIVTSCAERWGLIPGSLAEPLTYNYVAQARRFDGTPVILKICTPGGEFAAQAEALRLFDGQGAALLLESDPINEAILLECCEPGTMLAAVADEDDDAVTEIAASIMQQLWRPAPPDHPFPTVARWGQGFTRLRDRFGGSSGPLPAQLFDQAERLYTELEQSMTMPVVLHGDFHHDNILSARRQPWLVIDPKGLVGEPAYETGTFETGTFIRNNLPDSLTNVEMTRLLDRRIAIFAERLNLHRERVWGWALAVTVLSAVWTIEDHGYGWEQTMAIAEQIADLSV